MPTEKDEPMYIGAGAPIYEPSPDEVRQFLASMDSALGGDAKFGLIGAIGAMFLVASPFLAIIVAFAFGVSIGGHNICR